MSDNDIYPEAQNAIRNLLNEKALALKDEENKEYCGLEHGLSVQEIRDNIEDKQEDPAEGENNDSAESKVFHKSMNDYDKPLALISDNVRNCPIDGNNGHWDGERGILPGIRIPALYLKKPTLMVRVGKTYLIDMPSTMSCLKTVNLIFVKYAKELLKYSRSRIVVLITLIKPISNWRWKRIVNRMMLKDGVRKTVTLGMNVKT